MGSGGGRGGAVGVWGGGGGRCAWVRGSALTSAPPSLTYSCEGQQISLPAPGEDSFEQYLQQNPPSVERLWGTLVSTSVHAVNGMSAGKTASPGARSVWAIAVKFAACSFVGQALQPTASVSTAVTLRLTMAERGGKRCQMGAVTGRKLRTLRNLNDVFCAGSICHTNDNYFQQEALRWGSGEDNQE